MGFQLPQSSLDKLKGVHPDLVKVILRAAEISELNFIVTEGLRSVERQKKLVAEGKSRTMKSKHLTGDAVDVAVWFDYDKDKVVDSNEISWKFEVYKALSVYIKEAAKQVGVDIEWGGDWSTFKDGPHYQMKV